jgi:hypothetical protein
VDKEDLVRLFLVKHRSKIQSGKRVESLLFCLDPVRFGDIKNRNHLINKCLRFFFILYAWFWILFSYKCMVN